MATNPYFESSFTAQSDQDMVESLIIESIQQYGRNYAYLPRTLGNFDAFFGEDASSSFNDVSQVEMYLENTDGWEGEQSFISKFGMEIRDEATLVVSRKRWRETVGTDFNLAAPREGDIIAFPKEVDELLRVFEITWVDDAPTFYQIGKINTFRLKVRVFEYSGEEFDTGVREIDQYNKYQHAQRLQLKSDGVGTYQMGEIVKQGNNWAAIVMQVLEDSNELVVSANVATSGEAYNPQDSLPIVGQDSQAVWYLEIVTNDAEHTKIADNRNIEEDASSIIVNREHNPYSGH